MYKINEDLSIYATRGDIVLMSVSASFNGEPYTFQPGDLVRIKVCKKKSCTDVMLEKDFPITAVTQNVQIFLSGEDTKFGGIISKPTDYWYEIELNPLSEPQTIIGYDEDGAKVFKLFPEGADKELIEYEPGEEDILSRYMDDELDLTSRHPVENQVIARAVARLEAGYNKTHEAVEKINATPEMYGAIGDGVSDDTEAIKNALENASGTVRLTKTYLIKSKITVNKDDLTVTGGKLIFDDKSGEEFILDISGSRILFDNVNFEHIGYENAENKSSKNGICFSNCDFVTLRNCNFVARDANINGVLDFYTGWKHVTLDNCTFDIKANYDGAYRGGGVWFRDFYDKGCENLTITNCKFNSEGLDEVIAIWATGENKIKNVKIANTDFTGFKMSHLVTVCCDNAHIIGCNFFSRAGTTILKCFYDAVPATSLIVSDCLFNDKLQKNNSAFKTINNEKGTDNIEVNNCHFDGYSFGSNRCTFNGCNIKATVNYSNNSQSEFYSCKIHNRQYANQFIHTNVTIKNCYLYTSGQFIQPLYESVIILQGNVINNQDANFIVFGTKSAFKIMGNDFSNVALDLYSLASTDVVVGNRFAASPNPNNSNQPTGWSSNVIG